MRRTVCQMVSAGALAGTALLAAACGGAGLASAPTTTTEARSPVVATPPTTVVVATTTTTAPPPPTTTTTTPPPPPTTTPPGCYPISDEGGCYEPGEYCRDRTEGAHGVAGDGESIVCETNDGLRWEPT